MSTHDATRFRTSFIFYQDRKQNKITRRLFLLFRSLMQSGFNHDTYTLAKKTREHKRIKFYGIKFWMMSNCAALIAQLKPQLMQSQSQKQSDAEFHKQFRLSRSHDHIERPQNMHSFYRFSIIFHKLPALDVSNFFSQTTFRKSLLNSVYNTSFVLDFYCIKETFTAFSSSLYCYNK